MTSRPAPLHQKEVLRLIEHDVKRFEKVCKEVAKFNAYIKAQQAQDKPVFQWEKYTRFKRMWAAVGALDESIETLNTVAGSLEGAGMNVPPYIVGKLVQRMARQIPPIYTESYLQALTAKALQDVQDSTLDKAVKQNAEAQIREEHLKITSHLSAAKSSLQAVTELIFTVLSGSSASSQSHRIKALLTSSQDGNAVNEPPEKKKKRKKRRTGHSTKVDAMDGAQDARPVTLWGILCAMAYVVLLVGLFFAGNYVGSILQSYSSLDDLKQDIHDGIYWISNLPAQIRDITAHTATLESKMDAANERLSSLEELCNDLGLRIDSIWDSLGPPNEHGTYLSVSDHTLIAHRIREEMDEKIDRVSEEVIKLRKEMHRVSIRLTKDVQDLKKSASTG